MHLSRYHFAIAVLGVIEIAYRLQLTKGVMNLNDFEDTQGELKLEEMNNVIGCNVSDPDYVLYLCWEQKWLMQN